MVVRLLSMNGVDVTVILLYFRFKLNTRSVQYTTNFGDIVFYVNDDQGECQTIKNVNLLDK